DQPGEMTDKVRQWAEDYDVAYYEELLEKLRKKRKGALMPAVNARTDAEAQGFKAAEAEDDGDREEAVKLWQEVEKTAGRSGPGLVAQRHLRDLSAIDDEEAGLEKTYNRILKFGLEPKLDWPERQAFLGWRYQRLGDRLGARQAFEKLKKSAEQGPKLRVWGPFATLKRHELKPQDEKDRKKLVQAAADKIRSAPAATWELQALCMDLIALYGKDPDMKAAVALARERLEVFRKALGRKVPEGVVPR